MRHSLMAYESLYQNLPSFRERRYARTWTVGLEARRSMLLSINAITRVHIKALPRDTLYAGSLPALDVRDPNGAGVGPRVR